jgi:spore cortex protein
MKYAVIISGLTAILISGCATNDNGEGRNNLARNSSNVNEDIRNVNNGDDVNDIEPRRLISQDQLSSADNAANRVENLKEVKRATVILTDNNAYVGAVLEEGTKLTKGIEDKIASAVRKGDEAAERVYISTNPDFVERMDGYVNDLKNDRPVRGLADEFGETVKRVFPDAR